MEKNKFYMFFLFGLIAILFLVGRESLIDIKNQKFKGDSTQKIKKRWIVVFEEDIKLKDAEEEVPQLEDKTLKDIPLINATTAVLTEEEKAKVEKDADVERVDPDTKFKAFPDTAYAQSQVIGWGISKVRAPSAWSRSRGTNVKVAIIDTGISRHTDLTISGGVNAIYRANPGNYNDGHGHGTHVAGIVAATDNSVGVVGVGNRAKLYAVKVLNDSGYGYTSDIITGIRWAMVNGIQVSNMSFGSTQYNRSLQEAIDAAYSRGMLQVAAAGNYGLSILVYPAANRNVVAVSATNRSNTLASFSNRGTYIDFGAPGVSIYSTYKGNRYITFDGTSMAAPHLVGVAAIGIRLLPRGTPANRIEPYLRRSVDDLGAAGKDTRYGWGLPNALKLVNKF